MVSVDMLKANFSGEMENEAIENGDKPSLTELPDLVLRKVTKELDFQSVKNFRETCSRLFHLTPSPYEQLTAIQIKIDYKEIGVFFRSEDKTHKTMRIPRSGNTWESMLLLDWDFIFQGRKTPLAFFSIEFERYNRHPDVSFLYKIFRQILKSRPLILAEIIYLDASSQEDVLSILPYFNPRFLKVMNLNPSAGDLKKEFNMGKLFELEQLKHAEELRIWVDPDPDVMTGVIPYDFSNTFVPWTFKILKNRIVKPVNQGEDAI